MSALAQVLEEREAEILQAWMARVRQHLMAESRTQAELEDHLPLLLRRLQAALRDGTSLSDPASSRSGTQGVGREHGAQRFRLGFELGMLVREYGLLSDVLLELIIREGLQVPLQDVRRMSHFMSMAVAEAVEEHSRQETEQARAAVLDALAVQSLVGVSYLRGPEHVTQMANPLNRQLGGRDAQGLSYRDAFPELDRQGFTRLLDGVRETGEPFMGRETLIQLEASGEEPARDMYLDFTYQPVRGPEGGIEGILTLAREVTEQVLARRAAQRLAEEERRLRDFEQHLIGIVSHDLRNPLGAILLGLQLLLRRGEQDTRTRQALRRLESSTERAVRMVRDLLDFTQARLGGLKMKRASVNLHDVVRSVVEELQVTYPERELSLEQSGEGRGDWDGDRLAQLVGNLVSNALKYSPVDSPVTVHATGGSEEVRLEVRNRGLPISPEALSRLFQPMQRGREEMDNATRSVGLGLYIVDQIARAHGGDVQVTSSLTEGTCFRVRLPRAS